MTPRDRGRPTPGRVRPMPPRRAPSFIPHRNATTECSTSSITPC